MITYEINDALYINLTNRCTNNCSFCVRNHPEVFEFDLWLVREPILEEIMADLETPELYDEVVFCGYGEPLERFKEVIEICRHIKQKGVKTRINTNGQANLIWNRNIVPELCGLVDSISISLNAKNAEDYVKLCKPEYGAAAYFSVLDFARECIKFIPEVWITVVDVISAYDIEVCRSIAEDIGAGFRVRHYC
ncbi:MAG: TatD family nuclease-associated radical SAM protein [Clostridiaceae bacterium]|nr:TatD family nuclease-associated radical SAM protein [Clostridiaceae bacterium]